MASLWLEARYYFKLMRELLFPRRCAVCGNDIDVGYVCESCRKNFLLSHLIKCEPSEEYLAGQAEAAPGDVLDSILLLYKYDGVFKDALHEAKFSGGGILPLLSEEAEAALPGAKLRWVQQFDIITCVPTSEERRKARGYDVPQEIFGALLDESGVCVYRNNLLMRVRRTAPLFELKPEERRTELGGCFALAACADVREKRILLCDDIFTTGSTFTEAALVLRRAGAREVHALALTAARLNWSKE